jgi:hypothetical protein
MNDINNLISEELGKMSQLFHYQRGKVISEQPTADPTDIKTYPACIQSLPNIKIQQNPTVVYARQTEGLYGNYYFYNTGGYSTTKGTKGKYSCSGTDILIDGKKLTTTSTTYPPCITNKGWGEPQTNSKGQSYIKGGETEDGVDFTGYFFYNNNRVNTPKGLQSYKCSADNNLISIFNTPDKTPKAAASTGDAAKIKNLTSAWCREKGGVINWPGSKVDQYKWDDYLKKYSVTAAELTQAQTAAQTACPNKIINGGELKTVAVNNNFKKRNPQKQVALVNKEIQKTIGSNQTGSLSDADLQQLLIKLGGTA